MRGVGVFFVFLDFETKWITGASFWEQFSRQIFFKLYLLLGLAESEEPHCCGCHLPLQLEAGKSLGIKRKIPPGPCSISENQALSDFLRF